MASKRQKKKQQKKQLQQIAVEHGYSKKKVEQFSYGELQKEHKKIIAHERRKEQNRKASQNRRDRLKNERAEKLSIIEKYVGTDATNFDRKITAKFLDSLSLEELKKGKVDKEKLKDFLPKETVDKSFDFDRVYKIPGGKKLHIAFRSLDGNTDIENELAKFSKYSNEDLIAFLRSIKSTPELRSKNKKGSKGRNIGSSGVAGESIIKLNSQNALVEVYGEQKKGDKRTDTKYNKLLSKYAKKSSITFQHTEEDYYWQHIRQADDNGRLKAYTEITPRKLLIIANAVMHNIVERDRSGWYSEFYSYACDIVPGFEKILP